MSCEAKNDKEKGSETSLVNGKIETPQPNELIKKVIKAAQEDSNRKLFRFTP
jgi:hypothetical protein